VLESTSKLHLTKLPAATAAAAAAAASVNDDGSLSLCSGQTLMALGNCVSM